MIGDVVDCGLYGYETNLLYIKYSCYKCKLNYINFISKHPMSDFIFIADLFLETKKVSYWTVYNSFNFSNSYNVPTISIIV